MSNTLVDPLPKHVANLDQRVYELQGELKTEQGRKDDVDRSLAELQARYEGLQRDYEAQVRASGSGYRYGKFTNFVK